MSPVRPTDYLEGLVRELRALPAETEWVEFKRSNDDPEKLGEYISALSNSAALCGKAFAYLVWGIDDDTHEIVGTSVTPKLAKVGNEELESWLLRLLEPKIDFWFHEVQVDGKRVVILEVEQATRQPVRFKGAEHVRIGSTTKQLKGYPEKERALWRLFDKRTFEERVVAESLGEEEVVRLLDYPSYFELTKAPLPATRAGIVDALESDKLILRNPAGRWDITNLGAILFARELTEFPGLERKAVRVIVYEGTNKARTLREQQGLRGYANGFRGLMAFLELQIPSNEIIETALRKTVPLYPLRAVRELVANALIHQDFSITGAGPMIELFSDRMEITNPGQPLIEPRRFLDYPPRSRNDKLASLMRRMGICEERGSGIDKVVMLVEEHQLPAPLFDSQDEFMRVVLFAPRPLEKMDRADRVRACYLHACLKYVSHEQLTNASVRQRFGLPDSPSARSMASRYLREAVEDKLLVVADPKAGRKHRRYAPYWAAP